MSRKPDQLSMMHRLDSQLQSLDSELEVTEMEEARNDIKEQITAREEALAPVYLQAATEFADLHDKTGRMKAKGVIRAAVPWERSREYFFYRAKRRISEDSIIDQLMAADSSVSKDDALDMIKSLFSGDWEDNQAVATFFDESADALADKVKAVKADAMKAQIDALQKELDGM